MALPTPEALAIIIILRVQRMARATLEEAKARAAAKRAPAKRARRSDRPRG